MVKITQRENSTGYYYDLPKVGRAQLSRHYYDQRNPPLIQGNCVPTHHQIGGNRNVFSEKAYHQIGGNMMLGHSFQSLAKFLAPMGKTQLMAVIVLLVLQHFGTYKKHKLSGGGNYLTMAEQTLAPLGHNALVVVAALLLMNYLMKSWSSRKHKLSGGVGDGDDSSDFQKRLVKILKSKYNKQDKNKLKLSGGMILDKLYKIVAPTGTTAFSVTVLLILLDRLFRGEKKQKGGRKQSGGNLFCVLRKLLMPMGVSNFLIMLGLIALTRSTQERKKNRLNGGDCGCGGILKQDGGGCNNCGCGNNALEVVGDKALNYSKNLTQFGCKIPEWGYNLHVSGPDGQTKCI